MPVAGRETILVVALLNAGLPLSDFTRYLRSRGAASVEVAALLCKPGSHQAGSEAAYRGFDIPDYFVAGYGLQYAGRYGDLPYIAVIRDQVRLRGDQSHLDHRVRRIVKLLEEQCLCPPPFISIDELARSVKLSAPHLRRVFREQTDQTPRQYLKRLKLEKARELAEGADLSIKQILEVVGAGDESHFLRAFKKHHGLTLSQCRMGCRDQSEEDDPEEEFRRPL